MIKRISLLLLVVIGLVTLGCKKDDDPLTLQEQYDAIDKYIKKNDLKNVQTTASGLRYTITREGTGAFPRVNDVVTVNYEGKLLSGKKFDSSYDSGEPYKFTLGVGKVIKGWDEGVALLPVGSEAILLIPSNLGYGTRGFGDDIGSNQVLVFKIEVLDSKR
ncbi:MULTISPECIES: FKBP-type peptidyl-prolyl cis-trans isomerase [unclassified Imperialibacter]|uniref:FKBP-type peptidyl-prolyl cis-trans isomerase n=1 Tax=unclassified Imperialibacter TaxID=2629706 RepID=UPI001252CA0E